MDGPVMPSTSWTIRLAFSLAIGLALFVVAPSARAQKGAEGTATALQKKAMDDYLTTDFTKAQDKLEKAVGQCGTDKCSAGLRARLKRDLGVVQIGGGIDKEKGIGSFVDAIKIDPSVALDPDVKTKDLENAFAEAKKRASGGGSTPGSAGGSSGKAAGSTGTSASGQPQGDFNHTPVPVQQVRTPIPVYAEFSGEEQLIRVVVRYKGFGMTEWKTVELKKLTETGWGGLLPCADVQQGASQYYLQGFNSNNDPVATGGDRNNPYKVQVQTEKPADPPHLPNASPPTQCADTGDCPPNFPGCKKGAAGASASTDPSKIEPTGKEGGEFCEDDADCKSNKCSTSKCTDYEGKNKGRRLWIGVSGALDYTLVPSVDNACKLDANAYPVNDQNYYCVRNDADFPSRDPAVGKAQNDALVLSENKGSDKVAGGGALGNIRLMLTVDYAVHPNVLLGGRLGLVLNNYPGEAAAQDGKRFAIPIHIELRVTYVFGEDALYTKGLKPYLFGGAGIGQFETKVQVQTISAPAGQPATRGTADAWHMSGPAFVSIGGGLRYAMTSRFALMLGVRINAAFLNAFAASAGPELGGAVAF